MGTSLFPKKELNQSLDLARYQGLWWLTDLVANTSLLQLFLVLSDPSDFRMSVDNGWDSIIVDVTVTGLDDLHSGDT